jgi:hypothetical protein
MPRFQEAQAAEELENRKSAPGFNIFDFFGDQRKELFHSHFLAYLFDPKESHGQGHLFLETFFETLPCYFPDPKLSAELIRQGTWIVEREVITRFGRLDIVLRNPQIGALFVIENKVDAGEQSEQLARYGDYLAQTQLKKDNPNQGLIFLTIDGHQALTGANTPHCQISYRQVIHKWLDDVLPRVEALTVRETVRQYQALVIKL